MGYWYTLSSGKTDEMKRHHQQGWVRTKIPLILCLKTDHVRKAEAASFSHSTQCGGPKLLLSISQQKGPRANKGLLKDVRDERHGDPISSETHVLQ